jgi:hypothetical protein
MNSRESGYLPDARRINREIDIRDVAAALDIRRSRLRFHCWHPENHSHGDADPSVGYWEQENRLKCFVCDKPAIGVIGLVMDVLNLDFKGAIAWIDSRFEVPRMLRRKKIERAERRNLDGVLHPIDYLVRSHIFSKLSAPTQAIAAAMIAFSEKTGALAESTRMVTISYRALQRYSGLRSPNAVCNAVRELEMIGWLQASTQRAGLQNTTAIYSITPFSESVVALGHALAKEEQMAIEYERAASKQRRVERERAFRAKSRRQGAA